MFDFIAGQHTSHEAMIVRYRQNKDNKYLLMMRTWTKNKTSGGNHPGMAGGATVLWAYRSHDRRMDLWKRHHYVLTNTKSKKRDIKIMKSWYNKKTSQQGTYTGFPPYAASFWVRIHLWSAGKRHRMALLLCFTGLSPLSGRSGLSKLLVVQRVVLCILSPSPDAHSFFFIHRDMRCSWSDQPV